jgi:hypothetical protein
LIVWFLVAIQQVEVKRIKFRESKA